MQPPSYLNLQDGTRLAYRYTPGALPCVVFCSGFKSDMEGSKALHLEEHCKERGQAFLRFDYSGHGESGGEFLEGCIGRWFADSLLILETVVDGPVLLVGSSMGGWIALLLARARPQFVKGLVGIAAAPDFTERLMWQEFSEAQKNEIREQGQISLANCYEDGEPYVITRRLIEEGANHQLLGGAIPITCPVRLLQGMQDVDVPWQIATELAEKLESDDVTLNLVKNGTHRMSEPDQLALLAQAVDELLSA